MQACIPVLISLDTGRKFNVYKTFRRLPGRLLNVLYMFNLQPVFKELLSLVTNIIYFVLLILTLNFSGFYLYFQKKLCFSYRPHFYPLKQVYDKRRVKIELTHFVSTATPLVILCRKLENMAINGNIGTKWTKLREVKSTRI